MKIIKCSNYFILELNKSSDLNMLMDFLNQNALSCPHVIINILNFSIEDKDFVKSIFPFHLNWEKRNKSFILVSNIRKNILSGMISINSLEESIDFFHMEELTRSI
tara:strand:- start:324 stop:641 length:318 start_codon:yes stop_codon:yes gene_type:complete